MGRPVVHFEIGCRDKERTTAFYREAFGWEIDEGPSGRIATGCENGIGGHLTAIGHEAHNYVTFYVEVEHLDEALQRCEALGGEVVVRPVSLGFGSFAWIADVEGTIVGLYEPAAVTSTPVR